jgi:hypothetical protein
MLVWLYPGSAPVKSYLRVPGVIPNGNLHEGPIIARESTAIGVLVLDQLRDNTHLKGVQSTAMRICDIHKVPLSLC